MTGTIADSLSTLLLEQPGARSEEGAARHAARSPRSARGSNAHRLTAQSRRPERRGGLRTAASVGTGAIRLRSAVEWGLEWFVYRLRSLALFDLLELAGRCTVLVVAIFWVLEAQSHQGTPLRAWDLINSARGSLLSLLGRKGFFHRLLAFADPARCEADPCASRHLRCLHAAEQITLSMRFLVKLCPQTMQMAGSERRA